MSPATVFLARLIGVYCVVLAVAMLLRRADTVRTANAMVGDQGQIMLAGVIALGAGVATVLAHNVWTGGFLPVAVTVVGWVAAVKGALLLALPSTMLRRAYDAIRYERLYRVYAIAILALGASLAWAGFHG